MAYPYQNYTAPFVSASPVVPSAQLGYQMPTYQRGYDTPAYQAPPSANNSAVIWVQGEAGAKSYLIAPNSTVLLMDSDCSRFYLKSADSAGMPSLRTFEYKEVEQGAASQAAVVPDLDTRYVTREEYKRMESQYNEILERFDALGEQPTKTPTAKKSSKGANADE